MGRERFAAFEGARIGAGREPQAQARHQSYNPGTIEVTRACFDFEFHSLRSSTDFTQSLLIVKRYTAQPGLRSKRLEDRKLGRLYQVHGRYNDYQ